MSDNIKKRRNSDVKSLNHDNGSDNEEQQALAPSQSQQQQNQHQQGGMGNMGNMGSPKIGHMSHKSMGSVDYHNRAPIDTHDFVNRLSVTQPGSERGDLQELKDRPLPPVPADGGRYGHAHDGDDDHDQDQHMNLGITPGGGSGMSGHHPSGRRNSKKKQYAAVDKSSGDDEDEDSVIIHEEFKENEDRTQYPQSQIMSTAGRNVNGSDDDGIVYKDSDDDMVKIPAPPPPPALPNDTMDTGDSAHDGDGANDRDEFDSDSNDEHDGLYQKPLHHRTKTNE
eukprot:CAMPEP_0201570128 /NCGR_PEP_ID=MMETSP0190_2-20130828/12244_1 /ASSEMBLY_ACC=CAM_ASM_000263 /TAXON_ID=37353 /ORGANISM="Rosalina sp." /LENGTH=280 /DNA_ID=CAMNT_0047993323 /DNA_START=627 /DNA_END=1469 /DNA_ORIENTATION=-